MLKYYVCMDLKHYVVPQLPPPYPDATIRNYLDDSWGEGAPLSFVGFCAPQCPPPTQTPHLTI